MRCSRRCRACAPLRSRSPGRSTAPTTSSRTRSCARSPTSIASSAGTNLNAWLFTILRNLFHSEYRKRRREVEDPDGSYAARLTVQPEQGSRLDFEDFRAALAQAARRPARGAAAHRRLGLLLRGGGADLRCAVGTIKSRVNRARSRLAAAARGRGRRGSRAGQHDPRRPAGDLNQAAPHTKNAAPKGGVSVVR